MKLFILKIAILFFCNLLASAGEPRIGNQFVSNVKYITRSMKGAVCTGKEEVHHPPTLQCPVNTTTETCPEQKPCPDCPECEEVMECETPMCAECPEVHSVPLRYGNCDFWKNICGAEFCLLIALAIFIIAIFYSPYFLDNEKDKVNKRLDLLLVEKDAMDDVIATQRTSLCEKDKEIEAITTELKKQREINNEFISKMDRRDKEVADLNDQVISLKKEIEKLNTVVAEKTKELHGVKEQLVAKDKEINTLTESKK